MIFLAIFLLTCAVNLGCSVTVELYSKQHYSGLLKKVIVTAEVEEYCIQFNQTYEVRSLKTEKCIMVYETEDCKRIDKPAEGSKMYSFRVEKDTALFDADDGAYSNRKEERAVKSFHLCRTDSGAGLLNVDIYSGPSYRGDLVVSYKGGCKCKNIPSYIVLKGKTFSIDNHGNNMYFYDKEDCTGQERLIPAGDNERSRSVLKLDTRAVVIRSFRPAESCPKLDATVYKFTFSVSVPVSGPVSSGMFKDVVQQNTTYTTANRQHDTDVTEYINLNDSFALEYSVAKPFTYIDTARVKAGFSMNSESMLPFTVGNMLQSSLEAHYQYPDTNRNAPTIVTKSFENHMQFVTPPCTTCTVDVSLLKFKGLPITYTAEAIVTGVAAGDDKVSAEQIPHFLPPGMKYVKDYDDYSVVVTVEGEMKGTYSTPFTEKSCLSLSDCDSNLKVDL